MGHGRDGGLEGRYVVALELGGGEVGDAAGTPWTRSSVASWITTGTPSRERWTSNSTPSQAGSAIAATNAAIVFSGCVPWSPRWASRSVRRWRSSSGGHPLGRSRDRVRPGGVRPDRVRPGGVRPAGSVPTASAPAASASAAAAIGRAKKNVEPTPSFDSTQIRPPCCSTTWRAIDEPEARPAAAPHAGPVDLVEALEDTPIDALRDADPVVLDRRHDSCLDIGRGP